MTYEDFILTDQTCNELEDSLHELEMQIYAQGHYNECSDDEQLTFSHLERDLDAIETALYPALAATRITPEWLKEA